MICCWTTFRVELFYSCRCFEIEKPTLVDVAITALWVGTSGLVTYYEYRRYTVHLFHIKVCNCRYLFFNPYVLLYRLRYFLSNCSVPTEVVPC